MRKHTRFFWVLIALTLVLEVGSLASRLNAQQTPTGSEAQQTPSGSQAQQPPSSGQQQPSQEPSQGSAQQSPNGQSGQAQGAQTFTGTIVKSGDKYVLQDTSSGKTYDIDHQDLIGQHVGRRVRVTGTLDPDGKTIHLGH
jgi:uncharacterized protein YdeI (BOF family)